MDNDQKTLYDTDFYGWIQQQTALLKNKAFQQLDLTHLIEEMESMGGSERNGLTSHLMQLLMHLLKWNYQPERRSRSWRDSIINHRFSVEATLSDNPGLKHPLPDLYTKAYQRARTLASKQTGLPKTTFPDNCPWSFDEVMVDDFLPEQPPH